MNEYLKTLNLALILISDDKVRESISLVTENRLKLSVEDRDNVSILCTKFLIKRKG